METQKDIICEEMKKRNKLSACAYLLLGLVLFVAYAIELAKGNRTAGYFLVFSIFLLVPLLICLVLYKIQSETKATIYAFSVGYGILYGFVLLTTISPLGFTYIVLLMIVVMMYADLRLSLCVNVYAVLINIVQVIYYGSTREMAAADVTNAEIQIALIFLSSVFSITTTKVMSSINQQHVLRVEKDKERITHMLDKIMEVSASITEDIAVIYEQTNRVKEAADVTKNSMQELTNGVVDTVDAVEIQRTQTDEIQNYIKNVEAVSENIMSDIKDADEVAELGRNNMNLLLRQVKHSKKASGQVNIQLEELNQSTEKMHSIIDLINQITSQTGLLALNASIEAARAGEAGKGFAVVAKEISALANQTSEATVNITELINGIAGALKEVVRAVEILVESNDTQSSCAEETIESMNNIVKKTASISTQSQQLVAVVERLSNANELIGESIQNISSVTQQVSAHAQETLAGSEENNEVMEKIADSMQHLKGKAEELVNV